MAGCIVELRLLPCPLPRMPAALAAQAAVQQQRQRLCDRGPAPAHQRALVRRGMARELSRWLAPGQLQPQKQPPASYKAAPGIATAPCLPLTPGPLLCLLCAAWTTTPRSRSSDGAATPSTWPACWPSAWSATSPCSQVTLDWLPGAPLSLCRACMPLWLEVQLGMQLNVLQVLLAGLRLGCMLGQPPLRRAALRLFLAVPDALGAWSACTHRMWGFVLPSACSCSGGRELLGGPGASALWRPAAPAGQRDRHWVCV